MENNLVFELQNVQFYYKPELPVLRNINLQVASGEKVCILGANGCGKSTLQKILCGLIFPKQGKFTAFGTEINERRLEDEQFAKSFHKRVGFIFQNSDAQLFMSSVWDELAFGPLQLNLPPAEVKRRVEDIVTLFGLEHLVGRAPFSLSGGEKKKVAIAATLITNPDVLILDEPTNGLDPKTQRWFVNILNQLNQAGKTIITATHHLEMVGEIAERCIVFSEAHKIVADSEVQQVLADRELLVQVNLVDEHYHCHNDHGHFHYHIHNCE